MKISILNNEGKIIATFEWDLSKQTWVPQFLAEKEFFEDWWSREDHLYEANFHEISNGHDSFFWGSHRIFNLSQKGFEVLITNWKEWDTVKLDLEQYGYKFDKK